MPRTGGKGRLARKYFIFGEGGGLCYRNFGKEAEGSVVLIWV